MAKDIIHCETSIIPVYGPPLTAHLYVAEQIQEIAKAICPTEDADELDGAATHLDWPDVYLIFRRKWLDHDCIAHEIDHATHRIMRAIGMVECLESEEAYTYLNGWFANWIYKTLDTWKIKPKHRK